MGNRYLQEVTGIIRRQQGKRGPVWMCGEQLLEMIAQDEDATKLVLDDLTHGGMSLEKCEKKITSLPDNLTVGGWLDLRGTQITSSERRKVKPLKDGDYVAGRYLYCDGILTHVSKKRRVGEYTLYVGKIKNRNVVSDGKLYAHCETLRDGIADIAFKKAAERGAGQYTGISLDTKIPLEDAKTMYRIITGACRAGSRSS